MIFLISLLRSTSLRKAGMIAPARKWIFGIALTTTVTVSGAAPPPDWPMFGQNVSNTASTTSPGNSMSPATIGNLKPKWIFTTRGDVSARAAVVNGVVYFPDWGGNIWAVNANNGRLVWGHQLSDYGLAPGTISRTSPAVVDGIVYIGTQYNTSGPTGWLLAINAGNGNLMWKTQPITSNPFPVITGSPVVANGVVYVPMTSNEEFAAAQGSQNYHCCSVSGSVVAVNAATGAVIWSFNTVPAGYSGGAVWGSNPVLDPARNTVYVGTGNNYGVPTDPAYVACINNGGTRTTCQSPNNHADSIVALDMSTGVLKWATRLETWDQPGVTDGSDFWNVDCFVTKTNCPSAPGPDYDFGSAPNEITYQTANGPKTIIGAGQKSGIYYALDPDTGATLWQTQVGPGSSLGGMEWGSATDGTRIYVAIANGSFLPYAAGSAGSWAALDPAKEGAILWQVPDPNGAMDLGPMAVANGVVYASSMGGPASATAPTMFALDATNGNTLWSFAAGSSV